MKCQLEKTSQHSTGQNYLPPGGHIPQYTTKQLNSLIYNTAIPLAITKHKKRLISVDMASGRSTIVIKGKTCDRAIPICNNYVFTVESHN